ncbi:hypothetical protein B4096_2185 [Heyndrickxia coagulans]|nr:hypothetical protein B4096_2185 [Heyndrickxia coagulans]
MIKKGEPQAIKASCNAKKAQSFFKKLWAVFYADGWQVALSF